MPGRSTAGASLVSRSGDSGSGCSKVSAVPAAVGGRPVPARFWRVAFLTAQAGPERDVDQCLDGVDVGRGEGRAAALAEFPHEMSLNPRRDGSRGGVGTVWHRTI